MDCVCVGHAVQCYTLIRLYSPYRSRAAQRRSKQTEESYAQRYAERCFLVSYNTLAKVRGGKTIVGVPHIA